jgi:hypothetical protein
VTVLLASLSVIITCGVMLLEQFSQQALSRLAFRRL